jgi:hypothetical protein
VSFFPCSLVPRDFTDADYEVLLQLDKDVKKKTAENVKDEIPVKTLQVLEELQRDPEDKSSEVLCCICCEEFEIGCQYKVLLCEHVYHAEVCFFSLVFLHM